jgi:hypothetical protein
MIETPKLPNNRQYLLVSGCYRSATTITSKILTKTPDIIATDEINITGGNYTRFNKFMPRFIVNCKDQNKDSSFVINKNRSKEFMEEIQYELIEIYKEIVTNKKAHRLKNEKLDINIENYMVPVETRDRWIKVYYKYYSKDAKYYCDEDPNLLIWKHIWHSYLSLPNVKIIVILRDPREVIYSQINYPIEFSSKLIAHKLEEAFNHEHSWFKIMENWENIKSKLDSVNQDYLEIKHHNLCNYPKIPARKIANYLDIKVQPLLKEFKKGYDHKHLRKWKQEYPNLLDKLPNKWVKKAEKYNLIKEKELDHGCQRL